jgi:hypothetical protein
MEKSALPPRWGWVGLVCGCVGVLSGRYERKVESGRVRVRLIFEGCDLETLFASRLAVWWRARPRRLPIVQTRAFARGSWAFACVLCAPRGAPGALRWCCDRSRVADWPEEGGEFACAGEGDEACRFAALHAEMLPALVKPLLCAPGDRDHACVLAVLAAGECLADSGQSPRAGSGVGSVGSRRFQRKAPRPRACRCRESNEGERSAARGSNRESPARARRAASLDGRSRARRPRDRRPGSAASRDRRSEGCEASADGRAPKRRSAPESARRDARRTSTVGAGRASDRPARPRSSGSGHGRARRRAPARTRSAARRRRAAAPAGSRPADRS